MNKLKPWQIPKMHQSKTSCVSPPKKKYSYNIIKFTYVTMS